MNLTTIFLGLIGIVAIVGLISHIQVSYHLKKWINELKQLSSGAFENISTRWIRSTLHDYKEFHLAGTQVNTQALIEKNLFKEKIPLVGVLRAPIGNSTKMLQHLPSFAIILGVMGTFIGLTKSMFSMQKTLLTLGNTTGASTVSIHNIVSAIASPFEGMSLAFITSIAGIGTALLLNILQAGFISGGQSIQFLIGKVFTECESFLDHHVQIQLLTEKPKDTYEKLLDRLANKVSESFQETIGNFAHDMIHFTEKLDHAMSEVNQILTSQREFSDRFAESTTSLEQFGDTFSKATNTFDHAYQGVSAQIKSLEETFDRVSQKQEGREQRLEKILHQGQGVLDVSQKKTEELSRQFLRALDQQMQAYQDKYDNANASLQRSQDDWFYRHQDMQNQYSTASDAFAASVDQLEKSLYNMFEKVKRDILDQIKYQQERQQSSLQNDQSRQDTRDLMRTIENLSNQVDHNMKDSQRYLQEYYQVLQRIYSAVEQQSQMTRFSQNQIPSRVID